MTITRITSTKKEVLDFMHGHGYTDGDKIYEPKKLAYIMNHQEPNFHGDLDDFAYEFEYYTIDDLCTNQYFVDYSVDKQGDDHSVGYLILVK